MKSGFFLRPGVGLELLSRSLDPEEDAERLLEMRFLQTGPRELEKRMVRRKKEGGRKESSAGDPVRRASVASLLSSDA